MAETYEQMLAKAKAESERRLSGGQSALPDQSAMLAKVKAEGERRNGGRSKVADAGVMALHGALFGASDELGAATEATMGWLFGDKGWKETYDQRLPEIRSGIEGARENIGTLGSIAAETAGAIPGAMLGGAVTLPVKAANMFMGPARRVAGGAASGAVGGGVYGFAEGEGGAGSRAANAVIPAVAGGVLGGSMPLVAGGYAHLKGNRQRKRIAKEAGVSEDIVDPLQEIVKASGADTQGRLTFGSGKATTDKAMHGATRSADDVSNRMMMDMGPAGLGAFNTAVKHSGGGFNDISGAEAEGLRKLSGNLEEVPTGAVIRSRVQDRATRASEDFRTALKDTFGEVRGMREMEENLISNPDVEGVLAGRTRPSDADNPITQAYNRAWNSRLDYRTPAGQKLMQLAQEVRDPNTNKLVEPSRIAELERAAEKTLRLNGIDVRRGSVRWWDAVKREADAVARSERNTQGIGNVQNTPKGRAIEDISRTIRQSLGELSPDYDEALNLAVKPKRASEALTIGYDAFKNQTSITPENLRSAMKNMTEEQRKFVVQGAREALNDVMGKAKESFSPTVSVHGNNTRQAIADLEAMRPLKELSSGNYQDKLKIVLGDEAAGKFMNELDDVIASIDARQSMDFNVKEYAEGLRKEAIDEHAGRKSTLLAHGKPIAAGTKLAREVTGLEAPKGVGKTERVDALMSDFLTRPMDKDVLETLWSRKGAGPTEREARQKADRFLRILPWLMGPSTSQINAGGAYP